MNRRKLIYFLSAFVLIIGCYALNLSYSLFTQNILSENNVVDTTIPIINASLENDTFSIPANSSKVIELKIINSGTADIRYGISLEDTKGTTIQLVEGYSIVDTIESTKEKEVLLYVTNSTDTEITNLTFKLTTKYLTLNFDENDFINTSNIDCVNVVKLLKSAILNRAKDPSVSNEMRTVLDENFDSNNITGISSENDRKLILAEDDYGTSFVYRGAVKDNYVKFAGFIWRIVRINGDGSVRLILDGYLDKVVNDSESEPVYKNSALIALDIDGDVEFNSLIDDNAYVGYMYGFIDGVTNKCLTKDSINKFTVDSSMTYKTQESCESAGGRWAGTSYETTHINIKSSTIKKYLDAFYETYLENGTTKQYEKYLADTMFCGDKSLAKKETGSSSAAKGFGKNQTYYAATERLISEVLHDATIANPTLKCAEGETNTYSRYTVKEQNRNNINTNGDLKHPIALLSADELVLAGAFYAVDNQTYYLYNSDKKESSENLWWTLTPGEFDGTSAFEFHSYELFYSLAMNRVAASGHATRPVINLKADITYSNGEGTQENPYVIG